MDPGAIQLPVGEGTEVMVDETLFGKLDTIGGHVLQSGFTAAPRIYNAAVAGATCDFSLNTLTVDTRYKCEHCVKRERGC